MKKPKYLIFLSFILPLIVGTPTKQEELYLEATPSELIKPKFEIKEFIKPKLELKAESYVEHEFEYNLEIGEKIPALQPELKIIELLPKTRDENGGQIDIKQTKPEGQLPETVEIKIDDSSATISRATWGEVDTAIGTNETETKKVVEFLNVCHFFGPEPTSLEINDLPPSKYELSPEFSLSKTGELIAKTGEHLTHINVPISVNAGLDDPIAGEAALRNEEGGILILPYQAIELAQKRNRFTKNITEVELTEDGNNPSVYKIKSFEKLKLLGFITFSRETEIVIDANTGETLHQPWFSKLPSLIIKNAS